MVIKLFIFALLSISTVSYFIPVENSAKKDNEKDVPFVTFNDSTMYTLTTASMNRIIYAKQVQRYETKDVMYEGALTLKGYDKDKKEITDTLYSDVIVRRDNDFKFLNNVKYKRDDTISLNTDELNYNAKTKIATNSVAFDGSYFNNIIKGENLFLDLQNYYFKAKKTHFEIEVSK